MKRTLLCLALMLGLLGPVCAQRLVVAYVGAGSDVMPDMRLMTHIDYAFGHVNESFNGIRISRPERLEAIVAAKGDVKVCLSIGG